MNRLKRFFKMVNWLMTIAGTLLLIAITLLASCVITESYSWQQHLIGIAFIWCFAVGYPLFDIWRDSGKTSNPQKARKAFQSEGQKIIDLAKEIRKDNPSLDWHESIKLAGKRLSGK